MSTVAVRMTGISKHFGGVKALDDVDFEVFAGEVMPFWAATVLANQPS